MTTQAKCFTVLYGVYKPYKKHKQWTHDGILKLIGNVASLEDAETAKP